MSFAEVSDTKPPISDDTAPDPTRIATSQSSCKAKLSGSESLDRAFLEAPSNKCATPVAVQQSDVPHLSSATTSSTNPGPPNFTTPCLEQVWNLPTLSACTPDLGIPSLPSPSDEYTPPPPLQFRMSTRSGNILMAQPIIRSPLSPTMHPARSPFPSTVLSPGTANNDLISPITNTPPSEGKVYSQAVFSENSDDDGPQPFLVDESGPLLSPSMGCFQSETGAKKGVIEGVFGSAPVVSGKVGLESAKKSLPRPPAKPRGRVFCTCRKTMCLKLYCVCFQQNKLCHKHCKCYKCKNTSRENVPGGARTMAMVAITHRRPDAFAPRPKKSGLGCKCRKNR